ncbi:MAG: hypothetical protein WB783_07640 [Arenicellales bacterium]
MSSLDAEFAVADYAEVLETGGSVSHFCREIDLPRDLELVEVGRVNESIPASYLEICRIANWELPQEQARALRNRIVAHRQRGELLEVDAVEMLGLENRRWMYEQFEPINRWLGDLVGRQCFFPAAESILSPLDRSEGDCFEPCRQNLFGLLKRDRGLESRKLARSIERLDISAMQLHA